MTEQSDILEQIDAALEEHTGRLDRPALRAARAEIVTLQAERTPPRTHMHPSSVIYRGQSSAEFGLWREWAPGQWVFGMPVAGFTWRQTEAPDKAGLVRLMDEPERTPKPTADEQHNLGFCLGCAQHHADLNTTPEPTAEECAHYWRNRVAGGAVCVECSEWQDKRVPTPEPSADEREQLVKMNEIVLASIAEWAAEETDTDLTIRIRTDLWRAGFRRRTPITEADRETLANVDAIDHGGVGRPDRRVRVGYPLAVSILERFTLPERSEGEDLTSRDGLARAMCAVETRSKAATLEEVQSGIQRWTRHRYEAERLLAELADLGLEVRAVTERPDPLAPITDEMIEAAARASFEIDRIEGDYTWAQMVAEDPKRADIWREDARSILEAAEVQRTNLNGSE